MGLAFEYEEGQTPINADEQDALLIKTISNQGELNEWEHRNVQDAFQWTLQRKFQPNDILSETFCKQLHRRMYNQVWRWAGEFRRSQKSIGIEDWTQIPIELRKLIDDCRYWIEHQTYTEDEIAVRFKHRIVSIHCFPNGNGRHSRLMADVIVSHVFGKPEFTWGGGGNLVKKNHTRTKYIDALKMADSGNIDSLLEFARS